MQKEYISKWQAIALVVLFIEGESLGMQTAQAAERDIWLSILFAILIAFPISIIYGRLHSLFPKKNLIEIFQYVFGNFFGKIMGIVYIWYTFHTGSWILRNNIEFPTSITFLDTPKFVFAFFIIILCIWVVKKGIETFGRCCVLFFIITTISMIILYLMLIPQIDIGNIKPIAYNGIKPIIKGTFQAITFPFGETVVFLMILSSLKPGESYYKIYINGIIISGLVLFTLSLLFILVLGKDMYKQSFFPIHLLSSRISLGHLFQRMEMTSTATIMITIFVKISVYLYAVVKSLATLFKFEDYRFLVSPVGALMCVFVFLGDPSLIAWFELLDTIWLYYSFPFQVIIPLITLIIAEIKKVEVI